MKYDYGRWACSTGKLILAHRLSWMMFVGPIPDDLCVLHHCDNPSCVNPRHLWLGTRTDNNADRDSKGRQNREIPWLLEYVGEKHSKVKLTEKQVMEIRERHRLGTGLKELSIQFGMSYTGIGNIVHRRIWKMVP